MMYGLFVCHAGGKWGLGHLTRILNVAVSFCETTRLSLELLIQGQPVNKKGLAAFKHQFFTNEQSLVSILQNQVIFMKPKFIILDLHGSQISSDLLLFLTHARTIGIKVIGIDSFIDFSFYCDLVHFPSFWLNPIKLSNTACPVIYGWDSYLLAPCEKKDSWRAGPKVLVLTGGSDTTHLGQTLPSLLDATLKLGTQIHWVKGPYAKHPQVPSNSRLSWHVHDAPDDLSALMADVSYALTVYGVSFFELLQHGVPTVVFSPYETKDDVELIQINKVKISLVAKNPQHGLQLLVELMEDNCSAALLAKRASSKLQASGATQLVHRINMLGKEA